MPINVPDKLPAKNVLENENIFVMGKRRAIHQDIRPLKIALINLMPNKIDTETQIIRMISNTPLQIELDLVNMSTHISKNTSSDHFDAFYKTFPDISQSKYDGLIITGAPIELKNYEDVDYWNELTQVFDWAEKNVTSTLFLCWAGQAALFYHYGIKKYTMPTKLIGVYPHKIIDPSSPLVRGLEDGFMIPHARYTYLKESDIKKVPQLKILGKSKEAGIHVMCTEDYRKVFFMGHSEYDAGTLDFEYKRDKSKGLPISIPENYYPDNNPAKKPLTTWRTNGFILYSNWLNYFVYQTTPYNWVTE